jgi:hypothetical protein
MAEGAGLSGWVDEALTQPIEKALIFLCALCQETKAKCSTKTAILAIKY